MIKFNLVDNILNIDNLGIDNPIYCDTDSIFLTLPLSLEKNKVQAKEYINNIQDTINEVAIKSFLDSHNIKIREKEDSPLLRCMFKNEYMIKSMILYAKKRYVSIVIEKDKKGETYYDIDLKGVEGKRATNKFVKLIVDDLIEYLKNLDDAKNVYRRVDILNNIIIPYANTIESYKKKSVYENIDYFSMPVNVNKHINELKTVAGYYKGTIAFDIVGEKTWEYARGKGAWLKVILKDDSYIPEIMRCLQKYPQIKLNKKPHDIIRDITIPDELLQKENSIVNDIFNVFEIDYNGYYLQLLKKISLLYTPFDIKFCAGLENRTKKTIPANFLILGEKDIYSKGITCKKDVENIPQVT